MPLSEAQMAMKAKNKVDKLALDASLGSLKEKIDELFNDAPVAVAEATSKEEMEELISAVKAGTADNEKIARFLDVASNLGI